MGWAGSRAHLHPQGPEKQARDGAVSPSTRCLQTCPGRQLRTLGPTRNRGAPMHTPTRRPSPRRPELRVRCRAGTPHLPQPRPPPLLPGQEQLRWQAGVQPRAGVAAACPAWQEGTWLARWAVQNPRFSGAGHARPRGCIWPPRLAGLFPQGTGEVPSEQVKVQPLRCP